MPRRNITLAVVVLAILVGGAGYYFWNKKGALNTPSTSTEEGTVSQENSSFFDTFFDKLKSSDKSEGANQKENLKEYTDSAGIFSLKYPSSWVVRNEKGRLLQGASFTPPDLISKYSPEEQLFVKGLVVAAADSEESPENYYKSLAVGIETGQTEARDLTINGYPAYMVKGNINGVHYTVYIISHNNRIVYFNYRAKEEESARRNDIQKEIDFAPYVPYFEAAIASIKFLK